IYFVDLARLLEGRILPDLMVDQHGNIIDGVPRLTRTQHSEPGKEINKFEHTDTASTKLVEVETEEFSSTGEVDNEHVQTQTVPTNKEGMKMTSPMKQLNMKQLKRAARKGAAVFLAVMNP